MHIIRTQGSVFQVLNPSYKPHSDRQPPKRGKVETFSAASRRRLIDLLARMDDSYKRSTFVTLTFHQPPDNATAYKALKRFLQRVREYFPEASAIWRKEPQERGAIHYHLIFFNLPYWPQYHLQDTWTECTDEVRSIAHVKLIRKFSTYMCYISKYIAKADASLKSPSLEIAPYQQNPSPRLSGRVWGYFNKSALPFAPLVEIVINDDELGRYAMWACFAQSRGHCGDSQYTRKSYTKDTAPMLNYVLKTAGTWYSTPDEAWFATHDEAKIVRQSSGNPPTGVLFAAQETTTPRLKTP